MRLVKVNVNGKNMEQPENSTPVMSMKYECII